MQRLDELGRLGGVAERGTQPLDRGVDAMLEVDVGAVRPQTLADLLAGDDLAWSLEHHRKNLERLILQADADAVAPQLVRPQIHLESGEAEYRGMHVQSQECTKTGAPTR